jgi:hypothetical protein
MFRKVFLALLLLLFHQNLFPHSDEFLAGFVQSKLEDRFPGIEIEAAVHNNEIIVYRYPNDKIVCENIYQYLKGLEDFKSVKFDRDYKKPDSLTATTVGANTIKADEEKWLPELTPFFPTMLANPRIIAYSAGYRTYDRVFKTSLLPVSMGDRFSLYQFKSVSHGRLYVGIEACVWPIFEAKAKSLALINADYYVGIPLTYLHNEFAARLRIFHQSSHLGDELLEQKKDIRRVNPSMEVVDLSLAYDFTDNFTLFGGAGSVIRRDSSYKIKPGYCFYGFNYEWNKLRKRISNLEAAPYIGVYFSQWQEANWKVNSSVALGYQWQKLYGRKMRLYLEGYKGTSSEGQFSKQQTRYLALKLSYGY